MQAAIKVGKFALLLMIGIAIAILWVYCHGFLPHELHGGRAINPEAERFGGMVTLVTLFVAPALPIYRLFPTRAVTASVMVGWIPLALSLTLTGQANMPFDQAPSLNLAAAEGMLCWWAIISGTWTVKTLLKPGS